MDLKKEKKLWGKGFKRVVGLDEAGRGPLAGPVVAAAVMIDKKHFNNETMKQRNNVKLRGNHLALRNLDVRDSKKLSAKKRKELYQFFTDSDWIEWATGRVGNKVIDRINIWQATRLAMKRAVKNLKKKCPDPDFLVVDGNMEIDLDLAQKSVIGADQKIFSCALASIIAKFSRDRAMKRYHRMFPEYGFAKHKGYPTEQHLKALKKHGPCRIHRRSFEPVSRVGKADRADREIKR